MKRLYALPVFVTYLASLSVLFMVGGCGNNTSTDGPLPVTTDSSSGSTAGGSAVAGANNGGSDSAPSSGVASAYHGGEQAGGGGKSTGPSSGRSSEKSTGRSGGSSLGVTASGGAASSSGRGATAGTASAGGPSGIAGEAAGVETPKGLTLYYIRHAQVVANTLEPSQMTYENSEELTDLGLQQIDALSEYLKGMNVTPDAVLVSPHQRTQKTIEPYLASKGMQGEIWMELEECCQKTPTGAALPTEPQYIKYFDATLAGETFYFADPKVKTFWQNDTYEQGLFMVMTAKDKLLNRYGQSGKTIFVVGHASAGQVMIGLLRGDDLTAGPKTTGSNAVFLLNTGIIHLKQDAATGLFSVAGRNINNPKQE